METEADRKLSDGLTILRCVLAAVLMLILSGASACRSFDNGGGGTQWDHFDVGAIRDYPTPTHGVEDMEQIGGFPFVFPSYLPDGMKGMIEIGAWSEIRSWDWRTGTESKIGGPGERIEILRGDENSPYITIRETKAPFQNPFPPRTNLTVESMIGDTDVFCDLRPLTSDSNPVLECNWMIGDIWFQTFFEWEVDRPIPGYITDEMRQDAMKVVESMILAPDHP